MIEFQFVAMVVLGLGSFLAGCLALKLTPHVRKHPLFLSLILCLGGGVLLATALVHMLPEVREKIEGYAELYFCAGFFVLYLVDELTHYCLGDSVLPEGHERTAEPVSPDTAQDRAYGALGKAPPPAKRDRRASYAGFITPDRSSSYLTYSKSFEQSDYSRMKKEGVGPSSTTDCCGKHWGETHDYSFTRKNGPPRTKFHRSQEYIEIPSSTDKPVQERTSRKLVHSDQHRHHHHHVDQKACHVELGQPCSTNIVGVSGLLVALLIHSILEGISIGIQTATQEILLVLGAVSSHKLVLAYCLGTELASAGYETYNFMGTMLLFAVGSPIGIGIGLTLSSPSSGIFSYVPPLQAIAGGSLLYVAAFEVLPRERFKWQHKTEQKLAGILQFIFVVAGFVAITLLSILLVSDHEFPLERDANTTVLNNTQL